MYNDDKRSDQLLAMTSRVCNDSKEKRDGLPTCNEISKLNDIDNRKRHQFDHIAICMHGLIMERDNNLHSATHCFTSIWKSFTKKDVYIFLSSQ